jgi:hypothetical protein
MRLQDKDYEEFKRISDKEGITYNSDAVMKESADNLIQFVDLALKLSREQLGWKKRLEAEPKGFAMDSEGRSCGLCSSSVFGQIWYDKWGLSCMNCHEAYVKHIIPGYAIKDHEHEKSVTASTLACKFGLHNQTIMKLVRHGELKARQVPGGPTVFLRRENPDIAKVLSIEKDRLNSTKNRSVAQR